MQRSVSVAASFSLAMCLCGAAAAQTVPAATFDGTVGGGGECPLIPGAGGSVTCMGATASAYYAEGTSTVAVIINGQHPGSLTAYAGVKPWFEVAGPPGASATLLLDVSGSAAFSNGSGNAQLTFTLGSNGTPGSGAPSVSFNGCAASGIYTCPPNGSSILSTSYTFSIPTNTLWQNSAFVSISSIGANGAASIDPDIIFAPGFDSTGMTLVFSPDGTPPPAVPLPAPLPLLFSGLLGFVGIGARRRAS